MKKLLSLTLMLSLGLATISPALNAAQAQQDSSTPAWTKSSGFEAAKKWWKAGRDINALSPQEQKAFSALKAKVGITAIVAILTAIAVSLYTTREQKKGTPIQEKKGPLVLAKEQSFFNYALNWAESGSGAQKMDKDQMYDYVLRLEKRLNGLPFTMGKGKYNLHDLLYSREASKWLTPDQFFDLIDTYKDYSIVNEFIESMPANNYDFKITKQKMFHSLVLQKYLKEVYNMNTLEEYFKSLTI
ncbi:MAG TPA: hypothetical protein VI521_00745 [Candidatus Babeliales bacterium]|nr:hypothetical protein [Candidatus Babeliales bacterium]